MSWRRATYRGAAYRRATYRWSVRSTWKYDCDIVDVHYIIWMGFLNDYWEIISVSLKSRVVIWCISNCVWAIVESNKFWKWLVIRGINVYLRAINWTGTD